MPTWTLRREGEEGRFHDVLVAVEQQDQVYCFGRRFHSNHRYQIKVHVLNTVSLCWRMLPPVPIAKEGRHPIEIPTNHLDTAVLIEGVIYGWGGRLLRLYALDVDTHRWLRKDISGSIPVHTCSACALGKFMYLCGEHTQFTFNGAMAVFKVDTTTMVCSMIHRNGTPAHGHTATIIGTKMFVFGGNFICRDAVRVFDTVTNLWVASDTQSQHVPEVRKNHAAFTYKGDLYIFGGQDHIRKDYFMDLWKYSPKTSSWEMVEPRGVVPSVTASMSCCVVGDCVILLGKERNELSGTYVLDFSPSLKTLCKFASIQNRLEQSEVPHNIRWELAAMTSEQLKTNRVLPNKLLPSGVEIMEF